MTLLQAKDLMKEKGLTFNEIMAISTAIKEASVGYNPNIEISYQNGQPNFYKLKDFKSACFNSKEEALVIDALVKFAPELSEDSILNIFGIMLKLMGKETGWEFTPRLK